MKLVDALNNPPLKLLLSYLGLSTFKLYGISNQTMEEIGATNPKYVPAIASLMVPERVPTLEKSSPWHLFTRLLNK